MSSVRESETQGRHRLVDVRGERQELLRSLNDRVALSAARHHFDEARIPFQCECGAAECREFALHTEAEYEQLRDKCQSLLAPVHARSD